MALSIFAIILNYILALVGFYRAIMYKDIVWLGLGVTNAIICTINLTLLVILITI